MALGTGARFTVSTNTCFPFLLDTELVAMSQDLAVDVALCLSCDQSHIRPSPTVVAVTGVCFHMFPLPPACPTERTLGHCGKPTRVPGRGLCREGE